MKKKKHSVMNKKLGVVVLSVVVVVFALSACLVLFVQNQQKQNIKQTPVEAHGRLRVQGKNIVDKNGKIFQIRGVSTHGINLTSVFHRYINADSLAFMRDQWGVNAIRIARYTPNNDATWVKGIDDWDALIEEKIQMVIDAGLYVVIDWHVLKPGNPNECKNQALAYFQRMATKFKDYDHVIYEICNEPNGADVTWNDVVKPYAEEVIDAIRAIDQEAIIAVGSSTWSQDLDQVATNRIKGDKNLVYTLHFYATTHKEHLRNKLKAAIDAELPVLISEFGACRADGDGDIDNDEATKWMNLLNQYRIGYMIWQLSNKAEGSSLIRNDVTKYSDWDNNELTAHGQWFVRTLRGK